MPSPNLLASIGAQGQKATRYAPLFTNRFFVGLWTNRNPLRSPLSTFYADGWRLGATDALIDGVNVELSSRLTLCRRPGNVAFSTQVSDQAPTAFYSFHEIGTPSNPAGFVRVIVDTPDTIKYYDSTSATLITNKGAGSGQSFFQGVGNTLYIGDGAEQLKWNDFGVGVPGNNNGNSVNPTWSMGIAAPTDPPTINTIQTGAFALAWQANTFFSTMGIIVDGNGNAQQLISVNADGSNPNSQFGLSGDGSPSWNQTPGGTTSDGSITWTNWGPIPQWSAHTVYNNNAAGGTLANPCVIFDPGTGHLQINGAPYIAQGTSGGTKPNFSGVIGSFIWDGTVKWFDIGPAGLWQGSHFYDVYLGNHAQVATNTVVEPILPPAGNNQTIFFQISNGGTSGASGAAPPFATLAGQKTNDKQLQWVCLGSATWAANTAYVAWSNPRTYPFSVIKDDNGNLQVCLVSGNSGSLKPLQRWQANHAYSVGDLIIDSGGSEQKVTTPGTSGISAAVNNTALTSGLATYTTSTNHGYTAGQQVTVTGSTRAGGIFNVVDATIVSTPLATTFTVQLNFGDVASGADTATSFAGPTWNATAGGTTPDGSGTLVWTNQGVANSGGRPAGWGTEYGSQTPDGQVTWVCVGPSASWAAAKSYCLPIPGFSPPQPTDPFGGVDIKDANGNIEFVVASGFSGPGPAPTFTTAKTVNTIDNGVKWINNGSFAANGISWTKGYGYAYAYKARSTADPFCTEPPPGLTLPLGPPLGSADGSVSTASPILFFTSSNAGAINTISGIGSTDPQVDTIMIFRTFDGGSTAFLLTEIPNPTPIGGIAQPWSFQDFLPDFPNGTFPGLDILVSAPINHANDPPPDGLINLTYHMGRLWGSVGNIVYASGGPITNPGNGNTAWPPTQNFPFQGIVTRLVPVTTGLLVFTTSDLYIIAGGPSILTFYSQPLIQGLGLTSYNALAIQGGIIYLFTSDSQLVALDPSLGVTEIGQPIGDKLFNDFNPASTYVTFHISGSRDKALFIGDGSTGWYRCNPNQAPDSSITGPVWSPKANIVGGAGAIASVETSPGVHKLLIGSTRAGGPILARDSSYTTFSDNGSAYPSNFTMGSIVLAHPGQIAEMGFITCDLIRTGTPPGVSVLIDEISGSFSSISGFVVSDPPLLYGPTGGPATLFSNRYYFKQTVAGGNPPPAWCRHFQLKIDFGANDQVQNELLAMTIFGAIHAE